MVPHSEEGGALRADQASSIFQRSFNTYQKLTTNDYLEHDLLFGIVRIYLKERKQRLRILDLGCGDSRNMAKILDSAACALTTSYTGVDMSQSALAEAQKVMTRALGNDCPVAFHLSDMLSFQKKTWSSYDLVIAAYSLHHLTSEDKAEAFKEIYRLVSPVNGAFIMIDPLRKEGESLEAYHERATEVGNSWTHVPKEQRQDLITHMQKYDLMEPEQFFKEVAQNAGFRAMETLGQGTKGFCSHVALFKT